MKNLKSQFKIKNYLLIFTLILTPFLFFNAVSAALPECNDGVDNDDNGLTDYPDDAFACDSIDDNQEFSLIPYNPANQDPYTFSNLGDVSINQGKSGLITITASKNSGPGRIVQFSASGFPLKVTHFFNPYFCAEISLSCATNLAIDVGDTAVPGTYLITVKLANSLGQTSFNLIITSASLTQGQETLSSKINYTFSVPNPLGSKTIFDLIQRLINSLIIISVPIASILIIYSGILYMTSAGTDRIKKATSALVWTIAGFGLLLISSGIIDAVKDILGVTTDKGTDAISPIVSGGPKTFQDILNIFIDLANKFFTFAIIIASVMIIVSGISFMTARDDATKAATSRKMLIYAIIGVVVAIASTFIIQVVKNYFLS